MPSVGGIPRWRHVVAAVLVVLGVGLLVWAGGWWLSPGPLARGLLAYDRGDWNAANDLAREQLKTSSQDGDALRLRARSLVRLGRDAPALAIYSRLGPTSLQAEDHYLFGLAQMRGGRADAAVRSWEKAIEGEVGHAEALDALAHAYTRTKRLDEAVRVAETLARRPGWEVRGNLMLGTLRIELNDSAGAAVALERALRDPSAVEAATSSPSQFRKMLVRCLLRTGRPAEAVSQIRNVLAAGPDPEASWLLSRGLLLKGAVGDATEASRQAGSYRADHPLEPEPGPYVGEAQCASCHPSLDQAARGSRHAHTFHHGAQLLDLPRPAHPLADPGDPRVTHTIERVGEQVRVETRDGDNTYRALVEYAFGTPDRYVTMVARDEGGRYRALRLSYYCSQGSSGWDLSAGDTAIPKREGKFLGRPMEVRAGVVRCLYCHSTNPRTGADRTGPETADRGIGCERCHGPGGSHIAAVRAGFTDLAIVNPAHAASEGITALCADCHNLNPPEVEASSPRTDPRWARSPGMTLTWSRCYTESGGSLTCLTCHDPHRGAETSSAFYEKKCLSCHANKAGEVRGGTCPVNQASGCLGCHMPSVPNAVLHTPLTDHYIRVRRERKN